MEFDEEKIKDALISRALGYDASEVVEEYSYDENGEMKLNKKKVSKKHFAPDISAIKILLARYGGMDEDELERMTEEELRAERNRLLKLLEEEEEI